MLVGAGLAGWHVGVLALLGALGHIDPERLVATMWAGMAIAVIPGILALGSAALLALLPVAHEPDPPPPAVRWTRRLAVACSFSSGAVALWVVNRVGTFLAAENAAARITVEGFDAVGALEGGAGLAGMALPLAALHVGLGLVQGRQARRAAVTSPR